MANAKDEHDDGEFMILPDEWPAMGPYCNSTSSFANALDVTVVFLRVPLLSADELAAKLSESGGRLKAPVVGSITMPRQIAAEMIGTLGKLLAQTDPSSGGQSHE